MKKRYRIFVSGVQKELYKERLAVESLVSENMLLNEYFSVFLFEKHYAESKSSISIYTNEVKKSDVYIGLIGTTYGSVLKNKISPTEHEFRIAQAEKKEVLIFIKGSKQVDKKRDRAIRALIEVIRDPVNGLAYDRFENISELKNSIYESLIGFLRSEGIVGRSAFDESVCKHATLNDVDKKKVYSFLEVAQEKRSYPLSPKSSIKGILTHLNLLKGDQLTNTAILLFGKNIKKFHQQIEIKCMNIPDVKVKKPFSSYQIYDDSLLEQIDKAVHFVLSSIRLPVIQQHGTAQVRRPYEIPEFAVQEAIVNAVAHRNYNTTGAVQVMVFLDRIEVWNPGKLTSQLTVDKLKKPHTSYPNNPLLADILYLANYVQKAGSGTLEMIEQCKKKGLPEPEFLSSKCEFKTIISRDVFSKLTIMSLGINDRQLEAINYCRKKSRITNKEYCNLVNISKPTASRELSLMVKKGILTKKGKTGKGTYYSLKGS